MSLFNTLIPSFNRPAAGAENGASPAVERTDKPAFEVTENPAGYDLTVYLPGVAKDGVEIIAESDEIRIEGRRAWRQPEGWTPLHVESAQAPYRLVLTHDQAIDADKIHAELKDGVLRASLPKSEAFKPRKIAIA